MSEAAKVRDLPNVMKYITGRVADIGAGHDPITPDCIAFDGRDLSTITVPGEIFITDAHGMFDTIFSSHFLEHVPNPINYIYNWHRHLNVGGHVVLYLPEKSYYNNHDNPEHMFNWSFDDFMFWIRRSVCGDGKDFKGNQVPALFSVIDSGLDVGYDKYSFYVILRKL